MAQNVLRTGLPSASDGKNLVSIFADHRDIRSGLSIWQPFAPVYAAAGVDGDRGTERRGGAIPVRRGVRRCLIVSELSDRVSVGVAIGKRL
mgnify:CR=1 FL=1